MRRKDREIKNIDDIFSVIRQCKTIHIAMVDDGKPYAVALNFGFDRTGDTLLLYLHSAFEGRKMDILKKNPNVYFQMDCNHAPAPGSPGNPCSFSWDFDSVMGSGQAAFLTEPSQKEHALNRILQCVGDLEEEFTFPEKMLENTCVWQIASNDFTGKRHR